MFLFQIYAKWWVRPSWKNILTSQILPTSFSPLVRLNSNQILYLSGWVLGRNWQIKDNPLLLMQQLWEGQSVRSKLYFEVSELWSGEHCYKNSNRSSRGFGFCYIQHWVGDALRYSPTPSAHSRAGNSGIPVSDPYLMSRHTASPSAGSVASREYLDMRGPYMWQKVGDWGWFK